MSRHVADAVYSRWNAASLNTSIAPLYPANKGVDGTWRNRSTGGSPTEQDLPRAEYVLDTSIVVGKSRGSRMLRQPILFQLWLAGFEATADAVDAVRAAFTNSEQASSNPLLIPASAGKVMSVEHENGSVLKQDDELFQGIERIVVFWREANAIPS